MFGVNKKATTLNEFLMYSILLRKILMKRFKTLFKKLLHLSIIQLISKKLIHMSLLLFKMLLKIEILQIFSKKQKAVKHL